MPEQLMDDGSAWLTPEALFVLGASTDLAPSGDPVTASPRFLAAAEAMQKTLGELRSLALCGVTHFQHVEVYDLPPFARPHARKVLQPLQAVYGKGFQLTRVWQHIGPCTEGVPRG